MMSAWVPYDPYAIIIEPTLWRGSCSTLRGTSTPRSGGLSVAADSPSRRRRVRRSGSLRVDRLVPGQHRHALGDLPGARLGPLDGIDPADEGEAVGLGKHVEHRLRRRIGGD